MVLTEPDRNHRLTIIYKRRQRKLPMALMM
jgi:hypothetical protein